MKKKKAKFLKKPKNFKKLKENEKVSPYLINHLGHGCYEVILKQEEKMVYLTNFRNKKAAEKFILAHENGEVAIDLETRVPTPDFN